MAQQDSNRPLQPKCLRRVDASTQVPGKNWPVALHIARFGKFDFARHANCSKPNKLARKATEEPLRRNLHRSDMHHQCVSLPVV